jgi:hypothetical protein
MTRDPLRNLTGYLHSFSKPSGRGNRSGIAALLIFGQVFLSVALWTGVTAGIARAEGTPFRCPNAWPLRRAFIAFDFPSVHYSKELLDYLATRFEFSVEINSYNIAQIKQRNPKFYPLIRNSLSDIFVRLTAPTTSRWSRSRSPMAFIGKGSSSTTRGILT